MFWRAKLLQNIVLVSMGVKPSPAVSPAPGITFRVSQFPGEELCSLLRLFLCSKSILGQPVVFAVCSQSVTQQPHKERSFVFLPTGAPSVLKPNPSHLHIWSRSVPPQAGGASVPPGNISQQGEEQQAGDQAARGKLIKNSSDFKGLGTTNAMLNFSQSGHQHKPRQAKWRLTA